MLNLELQENYSNSYDRNTGIKKLNKATEYIRRIKSVIIGNRTICSIKNSFKIPKITVNFLYSPQPKAGVEEPCARGVQGSTTNLISKLKSPTLC